MLAGLISIAVGIAWPAFVKPANVWTEEQAAQWEAANDALHAARSQRGSPDLTAARERFARIDSELEAARYARDRWGTWIAGCGFVVTLLFGIGFLAARDASEP